MRRTARLLFLALGFTIVITISLSVLIMVTERINSQVSSQFMHQAHVENTPTPPQLKTHEDDVTPNENVHAFYYAWYGNPKYDKHYYHWNHEYIRHWNKGEAIKWPSGVHRPPDDIGASFYPAMGAYSSRDPEIVDQHMRWMAQAGIGVVVHSWYPSGDGDDQAKERSRDALADALTPMLLNAAHKHGLKVVPYFDAKTQTKLFQLAMHIEPYKGRSIQSLRNDLRYLLDKYGQHPAFYRRKRPSAPETAPKLPLVYIYDSYHIKPEIWKALLCADASPISIRGTELDAVVIGLVLKNNDKAQIQSACFDGFYTYFASEGFTEGSTPINWSSYRVFAKKNKLLFVPSVGPGYDDERVRPWNFANTKERDNGNYYTRMWKAALTSHASVVSITSFNEWHEGTQIEPARPYSYEGYTYRDYTPHNPTFYLEITRDFVRELSKQQNDEQAVMQ